jgi:hypothetical protein
MTADVFDYLTTETRRTPSGSHRREYLCVLCGSVVKILFGQENYEA